MKKLSLLVLFAAATSAAYAQVTLDSATISLSATGSTVITGTNGNGLSGTLNHVACIVTTSPSGSTTPVVTVDVTLDNNVNHMKHYSLYGTNPDTNTDFDTSTYGYRRTNTGGGQLYNDTIGIHFNVGYTNGLKVAINVSTATTAGQIVCSSMHT